MNTSFQQLLSERFEIAFNQIHGSLKKLAKNTTNDKFSALLRLSSHHRMIQAFQDELYQYAKLRNALVHEKKAAGYYIAEPHEEVVQRIENISKTLSKPNYALSIASKDVITFDWEDDLDDVMSKMKQFPFSQYPVYREKECVGLLTTRGMVNWMTDHVASRIVDLSDIKIRDVFQYEQKHPITFAPKNLNILEAEDIFKDYHQQKQDLEMIIITENGKPEEVPLGVVTAWDIIEVDYVV
ncbi:putative transcriptional regulator [Bacillus tianshenii]|uniref:Transcriptional regulator n=1 Tax=Sutcliffiella tianshenii TaxID=1463404 RepID=A0ABS2NUY2_9BACI|nr:CBS domain-containing protein [Bacillus tianshenii]MBM7618475.1 putative transcriptional regulator [Bacillus tianshenii]